MADLDLEALADAVRHAERRVAELADIATDEDATDAERQAAKDELPSAKVDWERALEAAEPARAFILSRLKDIGTGIHRRTTERDVMASQRREFYVLGEKCGLTHRSMAEVQGVTEGAVNLALRKVPGRVPKRTNAPAESAAEG